MIISPPFLPDGDVDQNQSSDDFVKDFMPHTGDGKFPVSDYLQWHGGVHLTAFHEKTKTILPVRAIADGKVMYVRQPTPEPSNKAGTVPHVQNHQGQEGWCDNGCVVIKHDTEIGEDLAVTFYSIYMHLKSIETTVTTGSDIHRKTKIGKAGQIYGIDDQIHFEIIADDDNTKKFVGDLAFNAPSYYTNKEGAEKAFQAQDGRTDVCFGSMYFYVPKFTPLYDEPDLLKQSFSYPMVRKQQTIDTTENKSPIFKKKTIDINNPQNSSSSFGSAGTIDISTYQLPNTTDISKPPTTSFPSQPIAKTVGQNIYVEMVFDKGKCTFITYDENGNKLGEVSQTGDSAFSKQVNEYNLYNASLKLYPSKPTAGFELLRFGRVIGDENFNIIEGVSNQNAHFREIYTPKGNYWINLNKATIKKYSDADFPFWKGWGVVNDDPNTDGRCDSEVVLSIFAKKWIELARNSTSIKTNEQAKKEWENLINDTQARERLEKIFYKFPSEWYYGKDDEFEQRYGWIKKEFFNNDDTKFNNFKEHVKSLAFWDDAGITIDKNHWHFPPIEFIKHFRKCSWLSKYEIKQLIPAGITKKFMIKNIQVNLNKMFRKYCINTPLRMASFFANSIEETAYLSAPQENVNYKKDKRPWYIPDWCGRGLLHLTHAYNYRDYFVFCGESISPAFQTFVDRYTAIDHQGRQYKLDHRSEVEDAQHPDLQSYFDLRDKVADRDLKDCSDSAGFYWVRSNISRMADEEHQLELFGTKDYSSQTFGKTAAAVNNPSAHATHVNYNSINGFPVRCNIYKVCLYVLTELKFPDGHGGKIEQPKNYTARGIYEELDR